MKKISLLTLMILSLLGFIAIAFVTGKNGFSYDSSVIQWVEKNSTSLMTKLMEIISIIGSSEAVLLITLVITVIFLWKRDWYHTLFFLTVSVGGVVLNFVLKVLFQRERPGEMSHIEVFNYSFEIPSYSFPSGHMMRTTILLLFLIYVSHRFINGSILQVSAYIFFVLIMVGVALSRLFLDAHFLSDILAAASISITWFCLCYLIFNRYEEKQAVNQFSRYRQWR